VGRSSNDCLRLSLGSKNANAKRFGEVMLSLKGLQTFLYLSLALGCVAQAPSALSATAKQTFDDCQKNGDLARINSEELARLEALTPPDDKAPDRFVRWCEFTRTTAVPVYEKLIKAIETNAKGNNCPARTMDTMLETLKSGLGDQKRMLDGLCETPAVSK
jgi:hypothetical protein